MPYEIVPDLSRKMRTNRRHVLRTFATSFVGNLRGRAPNIFRRVGIRGEAVGGRIGTA